MNIKLQRLLDDKSVKNLQILAARTISFYVGLKLHEKGNQGKPVINSADFHTNKI